MNGRAQQPGSGERPSAKKGSFAFAQAAPYLHPSRIDDPCASPRKSASPPPSPTAAERDPAAAWQPRQPSSLIAEDEREAAEHFDPQRYSGADGKAQPGGKLKLRLAHCGDDAVLALHFQQIWLENGCSPRDLHPGWEAKAKAQLEEGRARRQLRAWLVEVDGRPIGSCVAEQFPHFFGPAVLHTCGYIWGVYVQGDRRQQGIGKLLTNAAVDYLRSLGMARVMLHSAPAGKPVYKALVDIGDALL